MKKLTMIIVVFVLILGMAFTFTACNYENINSIEFSDLSDVELGFSLIFKDGKSYEGEIIVEPSNFDYREIEIVSDNPKIVDVEVTGKSGNYAKYKVTAKYNGVANIIAQTKDGLIKSSSKKFIMAGGKDYVMSDEETLAYNTAKSIEKIMDIMSINNDKAIELHALFKELNVIENSYLLSEKNFIKIDNDKYFVDAKIDFVIENKDNLIIYTFDTYFESDTTTVLFNRSLNIKAVLTDNEIASINASQRKYYVENTLSITPANGVLLHNASNSKFTITIKNNSIQTIDRLHISARPYMIGLTANDTKSFTSEVSGSIIANASKSVTATLSASATRTNWLNYDCYEIYRVVVYFSDNTFEIFNYFDCQFL